MVVIVLNRSAFTYIRFRMSVDVAGLVQKLLTKLSNSRDFTISAALHAVLIALFGGTVLYRAVQEPPDFEGEWGGFVQPNEVAAPPATQQPPPQETTFNVAAVPAAVSSSQISTITTTAANPLNFAMDPIITAPITTTSTAPSQPAVAPPASGAGMDGMSTAVAAQIKAFTGGWGKGPGKRGGDSITRVRIHRLYWPIQWRKLELDSAHLRGKAN